MKNYIDLIFTFLNSDESKIPGKYFRGKLNGKNIYIQCVTNLFNDSEPIYNITYKNSYIKGFGELNNSIISKSGLLKIIDICIKNKSNISNSI